MPSMAGSQLKPCSIQTITAAANVEGHNSVVHAPVFGDIAGRGSVVGYPARLADTNV